MNIIGGMCSIFCGLILLGTALFGNVTTGWLPDTASHTVLALIAIGSIIHGGRT
jgi:hypothetical protein